MTSKNTYRTTRCEGRRKTDLRKEDIVRTPDGVGCAQLADILETGQRIKQKQEAEKNKAVKSMNRNGPAAARPTINCSCQSSSGHSSSQCEGSNEQELQNPMPWNDEDPGALFHSLAWPRHPPAEVGGAASYDDRNEVSHEQIANKQNI